MKAFSFCILAAIFVCLWAAPAWHDLLPATNLEKDGIGDIWHDCSKAVESMLPSPQLLFSYVMCAKGEPGYEARVVP